ncbi:protein WVD2-like 7 isoform X1 [Aristolochia californica]|uniref:protein WVD2-like 7 isoform X1 n=1 Tax=Aristolochia californica TaxID=171875 RepID=UPI0035DDDAF7
MAAETEDPVSFQVDYLPTGSISFGRFEAESLDWERRSSFSHNRYLEEVEKCSKPGSVIEKKAYFEAHFKRKALLRRVSSESQSKTEYQSPENDIMDLMNYTQEYKDSKEKTFQPYYEATLDGSDDLEYEIVECETVEEILANEFQMESLDSDEDPVIEFDIQHLEPSESNRNQFECETFLLENCESKHVDETLGNEAEILKAEEKPKIESESIFSVKTAENDLQRESGDMIELFEMADGSLKFDRDENEQISSMGEESHSLLEVKTMAEQKKTKTKVRAQVVPVVHMNRKLSTEKASPSKESSHGSRKIRSPLRIKTEKQTQLKVLTGHLSKVLKSEDSGNITAKPSREKRSGKLEGKAMEEEAVSSLPLATSGKSETQGCLTESRSKQIKSSKKTYATKSSATGFSFKSDERAEKRKEFNSRLEEKMHAKEVEMNQIQARTQEEAQAKIKQFRRSLNFKATPMPSFYHEPCSQGTDSIKPATNTKSPPLPIKSTASKTRVQENQPSSSRNQRRLPSCKSPSTEHATAYPKASGSEAEASSPTQPGHGMNEIRKIKEVSVGSARVKAEKKERDKSDKIQQPVGRGEESALGRRRSVGAGKVRKGMVGGNSGVRRALAVGVVAS